MQILKRLCSTWQPPSETREITEFLSSAEGLALNRSFVRIQDPEIRRKVVGLVKVLASTEFEQENSEDSAATPA